MMGTCVHCDQPCLLSDEFIVRSATWAEAGLNGWNAGRLHFACFMKRLGRELKAGELLLWHVGEDSDGQAFSYLPEYLKSPEFRDHC